MALFSSFRVQLAQARKQLDADMLVQLKAPAIGALLPINAATHEALQVLERSMTGPFWARRWQVVGKVWQADGCGWGTLDEIVRMDARDFARLDDATRAITAEAMFRQTCRLSQAQLDAQNHWAYPSNDEEDLEEERAEA